MANITKISLDGTVYTIIDSTKKSIYSTSEMCINETWLDNKLIYKKSYILNDIDESMVTLETRTDISNLVKFEMTLQTQLGNQYIIPSGYINNVFSLENAWACSIGYVNGKRNLTAFFTHGLSPSISKCYITVYYTKK